jgi:phosphatidate cytidylyltransferase
VGDLKRRAITAALIGPLVILLFLFLPPRLFFLFMGCVLAMAAYEFSVIARLPNPVIVTVLALAAIVPLYLDVLPAYILWLLFSPTLYLLFRMVLPGRSSEGINREIGRSAVVIILSSVFLALPLFFLYRLKVLGTYLPFLLLAAVWASDTCAYLAGKNMGRHKLVPLISPKKTVEGLGGAIFGAVFLMIAAHGLIGLSVGHALVVGVAIGLLGQLGDILESIAKRVYEVKDSSGLIPGHGGVLDRLDSFVLTAPFLYYYLALSGSK